jgi:hypothetical protein
LNRTEPIVVHVTPELKARLRAGAEAAGLKLSPYCYSRLKLAEDAKDNRDAFLELLGATGVKVETVKPGPVTCEEV